MPQRPAIPCLLCTAVLVGADLPPPTVTGPAAVAGPYQRVEMTIVGLPTVERPADPAQIAVDAVITGPDGAVQRVPAFARKDCREAGTKDKPRWEVGGGWRWLVRYAPPRSGAYRAVVEVATPAGTARSAPVRFTVGTAPAKGMVRIAAGNPQAFAYDDGSPYIPWTNYRDRLPRLAANGVNWIRLWTGHPGSFQIEGARPHEMREEGAATLDAVLDLCEQHGIAAMICMEYVRRLAYDPKPSDRWADGLPLRHRQRRSLRQRGGPADPAGGPAPVPGHHALLCGALGGVAGGHGLGVLERDGLPQPGGASADRGLDRPHGPVAQGA